MFIVEMGWMSAMMGLFMKIFWMLSIVFCFMCNFVTYFMGNFMCSFMGSFMCDLMGDFMGDFMCNLVGNFVCNFMGSLVSGLNIYTIMIISFKKRFDTPSSSMIGMRRVAHRLVEIHKSMFSMMSMVFTVITMTIAMMSKAFTMIAMSISMVFMIETMVCSTVIFMLKTVVTISLMMRSVVTISFMMRSMFKAIVFILIVMIAVI